jgi:hypothetical protein
MTVLYLYLDPSTHPRLANTNNEREFMRVAQAIGRDKGISSDDIRIFRTGQDILNIISEYSSISRLCIFAHGGPSGIGSFIGNGRVSGLHRVQRGNSARNLSQFAQVLGPKLQPDTIIGLCACSCGRGPRDPDTSPRRAGQAASLNRYLTTGNNSFAYLMRDTLSTYTTVEVRAHTTSGSAIANPFCIFFRSPAGSTGVLLLRDVAAHESSTNQAKIAQQLSWNRIFRGQKAQEWIIGGPLPDDFERIPGTENIGTSPSIIPSGSPVVENSVDHETIGAGRPPGVSSNRIVSSDPGEGAPSLFNNNVPTSLGVRRELEQSLRSWADQYRRNLDNSVWRI